MRSPPRGAVSPPLLGGGAAWLGALDVQAHPRMRPLRPLLARVVVAVAAGGALALSACPSSPSKVVDAGTPKAPKPVDGDTRPPFPNMATPAWGQRVLEKRVQALPADAAKVTSATPVLDAFHELTPGSEKRAGELAVSWYKSAATDIDRSEAVALLAASLVLEPTVTGYKDRLTDARGLATYAATLNAASPVGQGARALVDAAVGSLANAKTLVQLVESTPTATADPHLFLALAQKMTGGTLDDVHGDLEKVLAARPDSARAHALLAELYLDVGLYPEAVKEAAAVKSHPWLDAVRGRALVLEGTPRSIDEGIALLKGSEKNLDEGRRGEVLYWLGRSLTRKDGDEAEVQTILSTLSPRAGYAKETAALKALLAQKKGDYKAAAELLNPFIKGPPRLPVDEDISWLLADACAGLGDTGCMGRAAQRAVAMDGDYGRLNVTRAAAHLVGKADVDATEALDEAFRASPFDPALAKRTGEKVVAGGDEGANRVRAARRALVRKSPKLVGKALAPLAKTSTCRVCRAVTAMASSGEEQAKNAVKALDGAGPKLCVADLVGVIDALGAAPLPEARKALDAIKDDREPIKQAVTRARADQKDPDGRRRRDKGEGAPQPSPAAPPPTNASPPTNAAPGQR